LSGIHSKKSCIVSGTWPFQTHEELYRLYVCGVGVYGVDENSRLAMPVRQSADRPKPHNREPLQPKLSAPMPP